MALAAEAPPRKRAPAKKTPAKPTKLQPSYRSAGSGPLRPFTVAHFCRWAKRLILDNGEPWIVEPFQQAFLEDVFAGYPECWLVLPEGNGKTTLIAGLVLYVSEYSPRPAEIPVAASSREQAETLYGQAERFILDNPSLHEMVHNERAVRQGKVKTIAPRFRALSGYRRVEHVSGSTVEVRPADDRTGDGVIFRMAILEELHRHKDLRLYRTWVGKLEKRPGGQVIAISTAGEPGSEFEEVRERIRQEAPDVTRNGCHVRAASATVVLHEHAVPEDGDVEDMQLVKAANPFSAVTVESLTKKRNSETMSLPHWLRFTCNRAARAGGSAITEAEWERAKTDERIPEGERIWVGFDVAWKWDDTAIVPFLGRKLRDGEDARGEDWPVASVRLFGPAVRIKPPRDGSLLDGEDIKKALRELHARTPIHTVVMDLTKAEELGTWCERELGVRVVDRSQSPAELAKDTEEFLNGLSTGRLRHAGDEGLSQHALNAVLRELPDGKLKFERPKASRAGGDALQNRRGIDALVAGAMVHRVWLENAAVPEREPLFAYGA